MKDSLRKQCPMKRRLCRWSDNRRRTAVRLGHPTQNYPSGSDARQAIGHFYLLYQLAKVINSL